MKMNYQKKHEKNMRILTRKLEIANMRKEERILRGKIFKTYLPSFSIAKLNVKFTKLSVIISFVAVCTYTTASILLQKYTSVEVSPTLTTAVFAFFGTELVAIATIKNKETRYGNSYENTEDKITEHMNEDYYD